MRFRSLGVIASNKEEYLSQLKELEKDYIEESALSLFNSISLEEESLITNNSDDLLFYKSKYKIKLKKRNILSNKYYFRKKIYFHKRKRRRSNPKTNIDKNNVINSNDNI